MGELVPLCIFGLALFLLLSVSRPEPPEPEEIVDIKFLNLTMTEARSKLIPVTQKLVGKHKLKMEPRYIILIRPRRPKYATVHCKLSPVRISIDKISILLLSAQELEALLAHEIAHCELGVMADHAQVDARAAEITNGAALASAFYKFAKYETANCKSFDTRPPELPCSSIASDFRRRARILLSTP